MDGGKVLACGFPYIPQCSDKVAAGLLPFLTFPILMLRTTLPNLKSVGRFLEGPRPLQKKVHY